MKMYLKVKFDSEFQSNYNGEPQQRGGLSRVVSAASGHSGRRVKRSNTNRVLVLICLVFVCAEMPCGVIITLASVHSDFYEVNLADLPWNLFISQIITEG